MKLIYSVIISLIAVSINAAVIPLNFASMTRGLTKRAPSPYNGSGTGYESNYDADDGTGYDADDGSGDDSDNGSGDDSDNGSGDDSDNGSGDDSDNGSGDESTDDDDDHDDDK
ncbi:hypothetical protein BASA50_005865 [Batrachochytrium salamandrivorans]|uniref:Uncharacterized protein n=1 Tax=Batrachochytrium salamandrivorans TaxID=1357716 RepID=A0ABQ8FBE7_9FUNG|nr:hypothetical protein BASA60_000171 [Batrachochytrium salamandrivorans]KAH6564822.1 hypothetical protein BASA62_007707 [Batrachochytrium salamandrivorans]KAH6578822.1 hypothetical protein BASA61_000051 [Batrachochytrium salamandrivorans]KAH6595346.1 hypothetical protein BASA50_005865 [Batrachochytrium salamandrivorans]KAH9248876.1 hypothetical protein BASA81_013439 [Batrachochytrium salamandrivorans]